MTDNRLTETVDCMDNTLSLTQSKVITTFDLCLRSIFSEKIIQFHKIVYIGSLKKNTDIKFLTE